MSKSKNIHGSLVECKCIGCGKKFVPAPYHIYRSYKDFVAWLDGEKRAPETGKSIDCPEDAVKTAKAEAYKEFAEKLKQHKRVLLWNSAVLVEDIDNVLEEMAGEGK